MQLPVFDRKGLLRHDGGVVGAPGVYVLGLTFLRRRKSSFIHGAEDDCRELSRTSPLTSAPRHADASVRTQFSVTKFPGGASRLASLLLAHIYAICSLVAPRDPGAAPRDFGNELRIPYIKVACYRHPGNWLTAPPGGWA